MNAIPLVWSRSGFPLTFRLTLSQTTYSSKLEEFADDNFEFDGNGGKFSKRVESTVGNGEIARFERFLLFHSVFKRFVQQTRKDYGLFWKGFFFYFFFFKFVAVFTSNS